ncbi:4Fe-4S binding protein [Haloechinothrix sp. YIM 98757]|uniref:Ferredoxin n=1 Tax=Haloechinothrix aidingensis TaxID=2752311 RepID=A0A838ABV0_9PSEU|nr:4Fe-4S binding protein [Haloechinothrix aidingensis]MBA0126742.1 4Fe-4S binding protein [Haloechinothrix aidingensis]
MAFVITGTCVADYSCVEVCPSNCIHPGPEEPGFEQAEQLYIDPHECIDCDACLEVCPVDAIFPADDIPAQWQHYTQVNADYFRSDGHD